MRYRLHPGLKILIFFALTILVSVFDFWKLLVAGLVVITIAAYLNHRSLFNMLRRLRWIILSILVIYSFNTPGEFIQEWFFLLQPTYEGVQMAVIHVLRLTLVISALAVLLAVTKRDELISGLYYLMTPLSVFGIRPDRFAVRLWLTLNNVEDSSKTYSHAQFFNDAHLLLSPCHDEMVRNTHVELILQPFSKLDLFLMIMLFLGIVGIVFV